MPHISVLIPTFNRADVLLRAVQSVLNQTHRDLECLVIDDGSQDHTQEVLEPLLSGSQKDDRLFCHYLKENKGVSHARNYGFHQSKGEWIALLDSDDEWLPHRLEAQLSLAADNPELPLIHGEELWVRRGKRVNPKKIHQKSGGDIFNRCLHLCLISPSATMMKRSLYQQMEGFREDYPVCEDYELWLRITRKYQVGFVEEPIIIKYGGHEDQLSARYKAMDFWRVKAMDEVFDRYSDDLREDQTTELLSVLKKKCDILKAGYLKHNNLEDLPFIEELLNKYQPFFQAASQEHP